MASSYVKKGWNPKSTGKRFACGEQHPNWKCGISKIDNYDQLRYIGKRKEAMTKRNRNRTKEQMKDWFIKSKYGISLREYEKMYKKQKGLCAICGEEETRKNRHTSVCRLHIDHDHITKKIRGLLCHKCNNGLGNFRDNPEFLLIAIQYLRR